VDATELMGEKFSPALDRLHETVFLHNHLMTIETLTLDSAFADFFLLLPIDTVHLTK